MLAAVTRILGAGTGGRTRNGSPTCRAGSMTPGTPTTGADGTAAWPATGSPTPCARTSRRPPRWPTGSCGPGPASCCCAGTARWRWPRCWSWRTGPGNGASSVPRAHPSLNGHGPARPSAGPHHAAQSAGRRPAARVRGHVLGGGGHAACGGGAAGAMAGPALAAAGRPARGGGRPERGCHRRRLGRRYVARGRPRGPSPSRCPGVRADVGRSRHERCRSSTSCIRSSVPCWSTARCRRTPGPGWPGTGTSATGSVTLRPRRSRRHRPAARGRSWTSSSARTTSCSSARS